MHHDKISGAYFACDGTTSGFPHSTVVFLSFAGYKNKYILYIQNCRYSILRAIKLLHVPFFFCRLHYKEWWISITLQTCPSPRHSKPFRAKIKKKKRMLTQAPHWVYKIQYCGIESCLFYLNNQKNILKI